MSTKTPLQAGFTLVEIMIVVGIIGLLASIAIPNFIKARQASQTTACINNLRQIDAAKQVWVLENGKTPSATPTSTSLNPYIGRLQNGSELYCPLSRSAKVAWAGYSGTINPVNQMAACANYSSANHKASLDPAKQ